MTDFLIRHAHIKDSPELARVLIAATRDAFRGRVPQHCLNWISPEESAANWARNFVTDQRMAQGERLYVAEAPVTGVVAFALLRETKPGSVHDPVISKRYLQELRSIQVDPPWQRQDLGRRLIDHVAEILMREGETHLLVRVLEENPNRTFYERLGAVRLGIQPYDWDGYQTKEILYGWEDISVLSFPAYH